MTIFVLLLVLSLCVLLGSLGFKYIGRWLFIPAGSLGLALIAVCLAALWNSLILASSQTKKLLERFINGTSTNDAWLEPKGRVGLLRIGRALRLCASHEEPDEHQMDQGEGRPLPVFRVAVSDAPILWTSNAEVGPASHSHSLGLLSFLLLRVLRDRTLCGSDL